MQCTRKAFWKWLVKEKVLDDVHKCAVLSLVECDDISELDKSQQINDEIGMNSYVLYNPTYSSQKELLENNKVLFRKDYLKRILSTEEYRHKKKSFESNKIARLNFAKLKTVDLRGFGQLSLEALNHTRIHPDECRQIWNAIKAQKIIDDEGNLAQDYKDQEFCYPECLIYENPVRRLIERTFLAEMVRRQWLNKETQDPVRLKAIADLALKPYQDLLTDLMKEHIISGTHVSDKIEDVEKTVKEITQDKQDSGRIVSFLRNHQAVYAALETPDATLESIEPSLRQQSDVNNISTELYVFRLVGFDHVIEMKEEKRSWKMILRASLIIAFGVAQVALGALIQMKFAGAMTHVASGLMSEGISDILFAMSALRSGNNFTWADYGRHKLISIAMTASTMGIAAAFSRGVKFFKYGFKTVGPGFKEGGKIVAQSASAMTLTTGTIVKQVVKTSCIKIGQAVGFGLLNKQIESLVNSQLATLCCKLGTKLIEKINAVIVKDFTNMKETLNRLYKLHGPDEAQRLVSEKMQQVTTGWVQKGQEWLSKIVGSVSSGLSEALNKRQMADAASKAFQAVVKVMSFISKCVEKLSVVIKLVDMLVTRTTQFHSEIKKCNNKTTITERDNVNADELERFQKRVQDDMKTALGREAGQMIESWTTQMLQSAAKQVVTFTARTIKEAHNKHKEKGYREELKKLQEERRKAGKSSGEQELSDASLPPPSEAHVKACLKLMSKTKDPKLFAALIREGVPADRFCVNALGSALPVLLQKLGIPNANVAIRVESSDDQFVHETDSANPDVIVIKVKRADGKSMGHFYSNKDGSDPNSGPENGYDCLFHCLANQIKRQYNKELNPTELREVAASMVEKDPSVSQAIRNGWHSYTIDKGFYGGKGKQYISEKDSLWTCGPYGEIRQKSDQYKIEADHQPAKSMWKHKDIKDKWLEKLDIDEFPCMSIPIELHKKTENYTYKAKDMNSEFNDQQAKYMKDGNYKEAMFHAVDKNWLEPMSRDKNISVEDIGKLRLNLTTHYVNSALNRKTYDNKGNIIYKDIIKEKEVEELKRRFNDRCDEITAMKRAPT